MSQENVEAYRRALDAWNRGALDEWLNTITPGWELVTGGAFPGLAPIYRGREGARKMWEAIRGPWDTQDLHIEIERIEDLGESAVALLMMRARGETSGVDVSIKWVHVITDRAQHLRSYASWDEGLKALGLFE